MNEYTNDTTTVLNNIDTPPGQLQLVCQNNHETIIESVINAFNKFLLWGEPKSSSYDVEEWKHFQIESTLSRKIFSKHNYHLKISTCLCLTCLLSASSDPWLSVESDQSVSGHTESQSALCQRGDKMFFSHNPLRRSLNDHAFLPQQRQLPGKEYLVEWKKFLNIVISLRGERSFKRCIENLFNFSFKNWVKIILLQSQA